MKTVERFWHDLGHQQQWLSEPQEVFDDPIYMMRTQPGFIFDDTFWETFQTFPFRICHVAYYGPERLEDIAREMVGVFELRFVPLPRHWIVRFIDNLALFGKRASPPTPTRSPKDRKATP